MKPLVIVGGGGMAVEALLLAEEINQSAPKWDIRGYVAARADEVGCQRIGYPVLGTDDWLLGQPEPMDAALAIGSPALLARLAQFYQGRAEHVAFPNLVHPRAEVARHDVHMGIGNLICSGVTVTLPVSIGNFNILNIGVVIHHDVQLGDFNVVGPGSILLGASSLGDATFLGAGTVILPGVAVGERVVIGAGAVVVSDVPAGARVAGVPARPLPERDD